MKKLNQVLLTLFLVLALACVAYATVGQKTATLDYTDIKISLNGTEIVPKDANGNTVEPFAIEGTTYLPVRAVANALGLEVGWDQETHTVILTQSTTGTDQSVVYISRTGTKYHYQATCNGGTFWPVPRGTAAGMGLTPCEKCILTGDNQEG